MWKSILDCSCRIFMHILLNVDFSRFRTEYVLASLVIIPISHYIPYSLLYSEWTKKQYLPYKFPGVSITNATTTALLWRQCR